MAVVLCHTQENFASTDVIFNDVDDDGGDGDDAE